MANSKTKKTLHILKLIFLLHYHVKSEDKCSVSWILLTPLQIGEDVELNCWTKGDDNCFGSKYFKWIGGPENDVIAFENRVTDSAKYAAHKYNDEYFLTIKNLSSMDMNVSYICHCGFYTFEEILQESLFRISYFPLSILVKPKLHSSVTLFANVSTILRGNAGKGSWKRGLINSSTLETLQFGENFYETIEPYGRSLTIRYLQQEDVNMVYSYECKSIIFAINLTIDANSYDLEQTNNVHVAVVIVCAISVFVACAISYLICWKSHRNHEICSALHLVTNANKRHDSTKKMAEGSLLQVA